MGATYSIFEDIPPSISFLNNQKQVISMETRLIVFYLDSFNTSEKPIRMHRKYLNHISSFKNRGFIVLTVIRNLETLMTDPVNGMIGTILKKITTMQERYQRQNIRITIQSTTFLSCGDSCANLLQIFDSTEHIRTHEDLYRKIRSDGRTSTMERGRVNSEIYTDRSTIMNNTSAVILINPTYSAMKEVSKNTRVDREIRVIYTEDHEIGQEKTGLKCIQKLCTKIIGDRIDGVKASDLTVTNRRNIAIKERKTKKITDMICHITDSIYESLERNESAL